MRYRNCIVALLLLRACCKSQQANSPERMSPHVYSYEPISRQIPLPGGPAELIAERVQIKLPKSGDTTERNIVVIYQPATKLFLFEPFRNDRVTRNLADAFLESSVVVQNNDQLVAFSCSPSRQIFIVASTAHAKSAQEARAIAFSKLEQKLARIERYESNWEEFKIVNLTDFPPDFFILRNDSRMPPPARVVGVEKKDQQWILTLEGPNKDFLLVLLDDKFNFVRVQKK